MVVLKAIRDIDIVGDQCSSRCAKPLRYRKVKAAPLSVFMSGPAAFTAGRSLALNDEPIPNHREEYLVPRIRRPISATWPVQAHDPASREHKLLSPRYVAARQHKTQQCERSAGDSDARPDHPHASA